MRDSYLLRNAEKLRTNNRNTYRKRDSKGENNSF